MGDVPMLLAMQSIVGGIITTVCWIVLWLKTGHEAGWAVLGILPAVFGVVPYAMMWFGAVAPESYVYASLTGWVLYIAYFLFFTFKPWPVRQNRADGVFE
jgi:hypothetical protein